MKMDEPWSEADILDRLVDSPLSPHELAELVDMCDRQPELWKRCALALLEEQTWRHEIQAMARDDFRGIRPLSTVAEAAAQSALPCPGSSRELGIDKVITGAPAALSRSGLWNSLAVAASILLAFGIGWQASLRFGWNRSSDGALGKPSTDLVAQDVAPSAVRARGLANSSATGDNMLVSDSGPKVAIDPATIEQVNAQTLAHTIQVGDDDDLEPEYQQLRQRGYEVQAQEGLMPIWLSDGTPAVVPYQQIKVRPKSPGRTY